jgi:uncharacterized protein (TIGR02246 family)
VVARELRDDDDTAAIEAAEERWLAAFRREDVEALVELYSGDAVLLPDGEPEVVGLAAIRDSHARFFARWRARHTIENAEIVVAGEWAFMRGKFVLDLAPRNGGSRRILRGKHLVVWQRGAGGGWRIARDIWNADGPAQMRKD